MLGEANFDAILAAGHLFDRPPQEAWTRRFLATPGHHLLLAFVGEAAAGFITGVEMTHPDKGTEMFIYELGTQEEFRRRGVGIALVRGLVEVARTRGCYGIWVETDPDNHAALATYRSAGFRPPEPAATLSLKFDG